MNPRLIFATLLSAVFVILIVSLQVRGQTSSLKERPNEFAVWGGGSLDLPTVIGATRDAKIPFLLGLRYGRVLLDRKFVAVEYTFDFVPTVIESQPKIAFSNPDVKSRDRSHIYGIGIAPIGFKFIFSSQRRVKPFVGFSSGPFYFKDPVPVQNATRFNFFSSFDGGIQISTGSHRAVTVGYKVGHVSNAGSSNINPGFNSSLFFAGFSIFK